MAHWCDQPRAKFRILDVVLSLLLATQGALDVRPCRHHKTNRHGRLKTRASQVGLELEQRTFADDANTEVTS